MQEYDSNGSSATWPLAILEARNTVIQSPYFMLAMVLRQRSALAHKSVSKGFSVATYARRSIVEAYFQNCRVAMRAPSAMAANFAQTTSGSTAAWPTQVP